MVMIYGVAAAMFYFVFIYIHTHIFFVDLWSSLFLMDCTCHQLHLLFIYCSMFIKISVWKLLSYFCIPYVTRQIHKDCCCCQHLYLAFLTNNLRPLQQCIFILITLCKTIIWEHCNNVSSVISLLCVKSLDMIGVEPYCFWRQ